MKRLAPASFALLAVLTHVPHDVCGMAVHPVYDTAPNGARMECTCIPVSEVEGEEGELDTCIVTCYWQYGDYIGSTDAD